MLHALGLEVVKSRDAHPIIQILVVVLAIILAFFLSGFFISLSGANPAEAYWVMFKGAFGGKREIWESLLRSTPIILTGLATIIAFRAQIWSIGQEGQLIGGAMLAYEFYHLFQPILAGPALILVIVLGGFLGGALLGLVCGWMRVRFHVDIIISTVLMNYIVTTMLQFLLYDPTLWMSKSYVYPQTDPIAKGAWYPILVPGSRLHLGFLIAIVLVILIYWLLKRTPYGFDIRALGSNPVATEFKGIHINRMIMVTMLISGGLAGLAGASEVFGVQHMVSMNISAGYGFTGIIVAMVAELNPLVMIPVAILFGGLINGSIILVTTTGIDSSIIFVIQAFVLLSVLVCRSLMKYRIRRITHVG